MEIRQAILMAADQIQSEPQTFCFMSVSTECGTPHCAIGWIGAFYFQDGVPEHRSGEVIEAICLKIFDIKQDVFYDRMDVYDKSWIESANICARNLRLYADKYHPAQEGIEEIHGLPACVRAIFDMTPAEIGKALAAA